MPTPLFNGRDLAGWSVYRFKPSSGLPPTWAVKDGLLVCTGQPLGYLATIEEFDDYMVVVEYRFPAGTEKANSGVLIHCQKANRQWPHSVEVQMRAGRAGDLLPNPDDSDRLPRLGADPARLDPNDKPKRRYMRLEPAGREAEKPVGEWNRLEVVCAGGDLRVTLNGRLVNQATGGDLTRGRIALQGEETPVEFRRVELVG
jgi:hypothetical protein